MALASQSFLFHSSGGERSEGVGGREERRTKEVGVEEEALFSLVHNVLPRTKSTISNSIFPLLADVSAPQCKNPEG